MTTVLGVKRPLDNPIKNIAPTKKCRFESEMLSSETVLERIKASLKEFEKSYSHLQDKLYISEPEIHFSFNPDTGEILPYFPEDARRIEGRLLFKRDARFKLTFKSHFETPITENTQNIALATLGAIFSKSQLNNEEVTLYKKNIEGFIKANPLGHILEIDLDYPSVEGYQDRPYKVGERLALLCKDRIARIASVKEIREDQGAVVFSLGENHEDEEYPLEVLSDDSDNPVFFRSPLSVTETISCYGLKIVTDMEGLKSLSDQELLEFWHPPTN